MTAQELHPHLREEPPTTALLQSDHRMAANGGHDAVDMTQTIAAITAQLGGLSARELAEFSDAYHGIASGVPCEL